MQTSIHLIFRPQLDYHHSHFRDEEMPQRKINKVVEGHRARTSAEVRFEPRRSDQWHMCERCIARPAALVSTTRWLKEEPQRRRKEVFKVRVTRLIFFKSVYLCWGKEKGRSTPWRRKRRKKEEGTRCIFYSFETLAFQQSAWNRHMGFDTITWEV